MKLDIDFTNLENLVKNMGASSVDWVSDVAVTHIESDWKIILETKGLDVDVNDIEISDNGLLKYRGQKQIPEIMPFKTIPFRKTILKKLPHTRAPNYIF